jgi:hypothetical protein
MTRRGGTKREKVMVCVAVLHNLLFYGEDYYGRRA